MKPVVVYEFDTVINIQVPSHQTPIGRKIWNAVNKFNIGKETVPLDKKWPEGKHGSMKEVHWMLAAAHLRTITVQVMSDGNIAIKKS